MIFLLQKYLHYFSFFLFGILFSFLFIYLSFCFGVSTISFFSLFHLSNRKWLNLLLLFFLYCSLTSIFLCIYIFLMKKKNKLLFYIILGIVFDQNIRLISYFIIKRYLFGDWASFLSLMSIHIFYMTFVCYSTYYHDFIYKQQKHNRSLPEPIHDKYN